MVNNTVNATYTETYDINTIVGEMSLLAVHTPQADALKKMFKGLFMQYKRYKVNSCDFQMVCASRQEISPELVGLSAGQIDPRDVLNPILFKACTGENLDLLLNQIYNKSTEGSAETNSAIGQHIVTGTASLSSYYQLLADDNWRKAHPQAGITVTGLKPMVHKVVTTQPFKYTGFRVASQEQFPYATANSSHIEPASSSGAGIVAGFGGPSGAVNGGNSVNPTIFVSNGITDMPWLDTAVPQNVGALNGEGETERIYANWLINAVPRVYMGCLVLPPCINQPLYYRLLIRWHISFREFRPAYELGGISPVDMVDGYNGMDGGATTGAYTTYWNLYHTASKGLDKEMSSFDANGVSETEQIMSTAN